MCKYSAFTVIVMSTYSLMYASEEKKVDDTKTITVSKDEIPSAKCLHSTCFTSCIPNKKTNYTTTYADQITPLVLAYRMAHHGSTFTQHARL